MTRILVVDDKANMRSLLAATLGELGHVVCAEGGTRALALLAEESFDVVVTDVKMPDIDGHALLRAASQLPNQPHVILMTGFATVESAVEALREHAFDYVTKPFDPDHMKAVVARAIAEREAPASAQAPASSRGTIETADLAGLTYREAAERTRAEGIRRYLEAILQRFGGNVSLAAAHADVERESFYRLCRRYGVLPTSFRGGGSDSG